MGGVQPALHNIANCYAQGRGVAQNDHLAFLYYEAGAEAGDPFAKFTLGSWLFTGRGRDGSPPDTKKGFQWQLEAAGEGHPIAMFNIGVMYMSGEVIITSFSGYPHQLLRISSATMVTITSSSASSSFRWKELLEITRKLWNGLRRLQRLT